MSKNTNTLKKIITPIRRFTLESFINTYENKKTSLPALLHKFPNYGLGFKVFKLNEEKVHWIIHEVKPISNSHAEFFGIKYDENGEGKKFEKLRNVFKEKLYDYEIPEKLNFVTTNEVEYDIGKIEKLRNEKIKMRNRRFEILEEMKPEKIRLIEYKKIKKESLSTKKKL